MSKANSKANRRSFLKTAGAGIAAGAVTTITGAPAIAAELPAVKWRLASSFPKSLETIFQGAPNLAKSVSDMTGGKFQISVHPAGELVPGLQVLDAVQKGTVECGHSAGTYYVNKNKAFAFDAVVPFGLTARQQNAWMYYGGGLELMRELFAGFNVLNFPGGNTGCQMAGWFRKEINSLTDLKGLKMRIPGLGGEVMSKLGVLPQTLPGSEIYAALEKGTLDATEWVGPYDDERLGFYKVANHYYYPGWWEPAAQLSFLVSMKEWKKLPTAYQQVFTIAAADANVRMLAEYDHKNPQAILKLLGYGVKLHRFPTDVMVAAHEAAFAMYSDEAAKDPIFKKIYSEWSKYRRTIQRWHGLAEYSMEGFMYQGTRR